MSGIKRACNRPKLAKHLRNTSEKTHVNRTKEERDRDHATSDAWAERERAKEPERAIASIQARLRNDELTSRERQALSERLLKLQMQA